MFTMILIMIFFHFLIDYPGQGDFLSKAKNRFNPVPGVPWYQAMTAHAFMHGFVVWFMTGSLILFVFEFFAHFIIDDLKCAGKLSFNEDQILHIMLKIAYVLGLFLFVGSENIISSFG